MTDLPYRETWRRWAVALVVAVSPTMMVVGAAAGAESVTPPQLSIAIDNGHTSADPGDSLTYRIVVKNLGANRVRNLHITQSLPSGLTVQKADFDGVASPTKVSWVITLPPAAEMTLSTSATVARTSAQTLRLASVACAGMSAKGPAVVCASDSDQLAAGAKAVAAAAHPGDDDSLWWIRSGIAVGVGVGAVLLAARRRRRRMDQVARRSPGSR